MNTSYKNHDVDEPGFFIGMALPSQDQRGRDRDLSDRII